MQTLEVDAVLTNLTIFNYDALVWEMEKEPVYVPDSAPQLLHLYTITGLILIGYWPQGGLIGEHYTAWAHLDSGCEDLVYTLH